MSEIAAEAKMPEDHAPQPVSVGYRRYALGLLLAIYTLNFLDRQVVNILAEPIKRDLHLADWQLGMMTGFAFAILYTVLGIPIARQAEIGNRPRIIAGAVAVWSFFTVLCGMAQNFWQLVLARVGVGIGEAGCTPPAHSLISDYVPKEKRSSAIAFYSMGNPLGSLIGLAMGGLIADAYGWRTAFLVAGAPGLILAVVILFSLVEPRKQLAADLERRRADAPSFKEAMAILKGKPTFWRIAFAVAIVAFIGYGHAPFTASFFFRVHGEELTVLAAQLSEVVGAKIGIAGFLGLALSLSAGTAGVIGTFVGGALGDKLGSRDERAYMMLPAIASVVTIPAYIWAVLQSSALLTLLALSVTTVIAAMWQGPVFATVQSIVEPRMRATCAAIVLFVANLIGLGLGPVIVGAMSDIFAGPMGMGEAEGVRWALIASSLLGVVAFWLFWQASKTVREDTVS